MLEYLPLLVLRFSLTTLMAAYLPPYKGDILRRALLWHLGPLWCQASGHCHGGCQQPSTCLFGRLLSLPSHGEWANSMQKLIGDTPPPAYVLWDRQDRRCAFKVGETLQFELTLIGEMAIQQQAAFVAALQVACERGLGREKLKAQLVKVEVIAGPDVTPQTVMMDGIWKDATAEPVILNYQNALTWVARQAETRRLKLHFLNPLKVKMRGEVMQTPDFVAVMRAVVRRLRILSQVHGASEWPREAWGPLLDMAEQVRLEHHEIAWVETERHSRQGVMPLDGLIGQAWYVASVDLRPLLPALWLGQWVHIGKATVWGNGRYAVEII